MRPSFDEWCLDLAEVVSRRSKDPSTKVGAVIVDEDGGAVSWGYNGMPRGCSDKEEFFTDRQFKYSTILHAEENAVHFANRSLKGCSIYLTHPPCVKCISMLSQRGLKRAVFPKVEDCWKERWNWPTVIMWAKECSLELKEVKYMREEYNGLISSEGAGI